MTKTKRKLQVRVKRAFRESVKARKRHARAVKAYKQLVRRYKAA